MINQLPSDLYKQLEDAIKKTYPNIYPSLNPSITTKKDGDNWKATVEFPSEGAITADAEFEHSPDKGWRKIYDWNG
jgi:hypothetical protein